MESGSASEENQGWQEIPSRHHPSLDDPEVAKISFDVASVSDTVSPSRFRVLKTLNEEDETLEEGELFEE